MNPHWSPQPHAAHVIAELVAALLTRSPFANGMAQRMRTHSATDITAWLDHLALHPDAQREAAWISAGFVAEAQAPGLVAYRHPGGRFPALVADRSLAPETLVAAMQVESVDEARAAWGGDQPTGTLGSQCRRVRLSSGPGWAVDAVERHGWSGFAEPLAEQTNNTTPRQVDLVLRHQEALRNRPRRGDPVQLFTDLRQRIEQAVNDLGRDEACVRFFAAERDYWQQRNRAARIQRGRQDALGLGWANHDHHTYRSSRRWFSELISLLGLLGLHCRERFHAGAEAGWGAQVLEQPNTGIVVFADVDLTPEEVSGDLGRIALPELPRLGTVGLWCALHGEALLDAGMHHLECTFLHDELTNQLTGLGVAMMKPFTDLPQLKQAFTVGEHWPVAPARLHDLVQRGVLTVEQAEGFRHHGALGSHLENLERRDGYKGFNQRGVSHIIAGTDPRTARTPSH